MYKLPYERIHNFLETNSAPAMLSIGIITRKTTEREVCEEIFLENSNDTKKLCFVKAYFLRWKLQEQKVHKKRLSSCLLFLWPTETPFEEKLKLFGNKHFIERALQ